MKPREFLDKLAVSRSLIFDLDNTIFDENKFLFTVYKKIARCTAKVSGLDYRELYGFLSKTFLCDGRRNLFDKFLREFDLLSYITTQDLVAILREPFGFKLRCFKYFSTYLLNMRRTFIITNGNSMQQRRKYEALGLQAYGSIIGLVCADEYVPKPQPNAYYRLAERYALVRPIYVGDSEVDEEFSRQCRIGFAKLVFDRDADGFAIESSMDIL